MKKLTLVVIGAALIAGSSIAGTGVAAAKVQKCPTGSYAIVVDPGPVWGCTKSIWETGHHRRHHHP